MKAFLLSIPDRLRQADQTADVSSVLCSKSWEVLNDDGVKQVFIFKPNKELIISTKGDVVMSEWDYLSVNNSILIKTENKSSMFHPAYLNENLLAFEKDGCRECVVLIDEKDTVDFPKRTLAEVNQYFIEKEKAEIKRLTQTQATIAQTEREKKLQKLKEEWIKSEKEIYRRKNAGKIKTYHKIARYFFYASFCLLFFFIVLLALNIDYLYYVGIMGCVCSAFLISGMVCFILKDNLENPDIDVSRFNPDEFKEELDTK